MKHCLAMLFSSCLLLPFAAAQQILSSSIIELTKKAEAGDPQAQFELADDYEKGNGVTEDPQAAFQWCRKAAEQGYAKAQNTLGVMYAQGTGVPKDKEEAFRLYKKAAREGLPEADYNVGISYFNGDGVGTDVNRAYAWIWLAQQHGNSSATAALKRIAEQVNNRLAMSKFFVADLLIKGVETPTDIRQAGAILDELSEQEGHPGIGELQYEICQDYAAGKNVTQDYVQAKSWCRKAAESSENKAFMVLGKMAEEGFGGPRDLNEAEIWYEDAAVELWTEGMMALGKLKAESITHEDQKQAYFWFYLAQKQENKDADAKLQEAAARLTSEEIDIEQQKASLWMAESAGSDAKLKYP